MRRVKHAARLARPLTDFAFSHSLPCLSPRATRTNTYTSPRLPTCDRIGARRTHTPRDARFSSERTREVPPFFSLSPSSLPICRRPPTPAHETLTTKEGEANAWRCCCEKEKTQPRATPFLKRETRTPKNGVPRLGFSRRPAVSGRRSDLHHAGGRHPTCPGGVGQQSRGGDGHHPVGKGE